MEVMTMSTNVLVRLPMSTTNSRAHEERLIRHPHSFSSPAIKPKPTQRRQRLLVVQAKGKRGSMDRQFQRNGPPPLPKIEDDGNPRFVIFIRMPEFYFWYPLTLITGGTTAKIMVAAKDSFVGKYLFKETLARNLAAVIYRDENEIRKQAVQQYRVLRTSSEFRYGYKLVVNKNLRAALTTSNVIELPKKEEMKTVLDKVKDFFGDAKESFGKMTALDLTTNEETEEKPQEKSKVKR